MSVVSGTSRSVARSPLGRLSLGFILAMGIATGSGAELAEAKSSDARADGKRAVSGHVVASASSSRKSASRKSRAGKSRAAKSRARSGGKSRGHARATGRKIG